MAFLDQVCAGDLELRGEVESLLASWDRSSSFLEHPAFEVAADIPAAVQSRSLIGCQLGACQVLSLLGKGGMGEVYLARDSHLDRQVALKVLPPEVTEGPERLKRFVREAKAASALNHPNTATRIFSNLRGFASYGEDLSLIKQVVLPFRDGMNFELRLDIANLLTELVFATHRPM